MWGRRGQGGHKVQREGEEGAGGTAPTGGEWY